MPEYFCTQITDYVLPQKIGHKNEKILQYNFQYKYAKHHHCDLQQSIEVKVKDIIIHSFVDEQRPYHTLRCDQLSQQSRKDEMSLVSFTERQYPHQYGPVKLISFYLRHRDQR